MLAMTAIQIRSTALPPHFPSTARIQNWQVRPGELLAVLVQREGSWTAPLMRDDRYCGSVGMDILRWRLARVRVILREGGLVVLLLQGCTAVHIGVKGEGCVF